MPQVYIVGGHWGALPQAYASFKQNFFMHASNGSYFFYTAFEATKMIKRATIKIFFI